MTKDTIHVTDLEGKLTLLWQLLEPKLEGVLDAFYEDLHTDSHLASLTKGQEPRLKAAQYRHWEQTFNNGFDADYYERTHRIGVAHVKIGLLPADYIAGYQFIKQKLNNALFKHKSKFFQKLPYTMHELMDALDVVIYKDMIQSISSYEEVLKEQEAKTQAQSLAEFSDDISNPVESIASASEEFNASLLSIADQTVSNAQLIENTSEETQRAANEINSLDTHVREINEFVTIIEDLAAQTNLLALNASIEAARAGDAGRGFAVVADEVKKLSQNTETAAQKISQKVCSVLEATSVAVQRVMTSTQHTENLKESFDSITVAVEQQKDAFQDINMSIDSISSYIDQRSGELLANLK